MNCGISSRQESYGQARVRSTVAKEGRRSQCHVIVQYVSSRKGKALEEFKTELIYVQILQSGSHKSPNRLYLHSGTLNNSIIH